MGRWSPSLTKNKAAKHKGNKYKSAVTDNTSQDNFYTTESNEKRDKYNHTNKYKNYKDYFTTDIYDSELFDTFSPKRKGSGESTYDDYTTSGVSYMERKRRPKDLIYSVSTSDYLLKPPEKYDNVSSFRDYEHSYPIGTKSREKKRLRLANDLDKSNYHNMLDESDLYVDSRRKYRSPRSRYYQDLIHEEPEKEYDYGKYFEKTNPKVGSSPKQKRLDKYEDERYEKENKKLSQSPNKHKQYQVYAYQDPKHHEEVFKSKNRPEDLSFSSEVEIKTHEYPVLAFRDPKSGNKESDMVYLPIMVLDKKSAKSRPEKRPEEPIYQSTKDNFQVYAANLQEQQNIFQNFGDLSNIPTSKEPTSKDRDLSPKQDLGIEAISGMRYAGSLLGTIIDEAVASDFDFQNEYLSNETEAGQRTPFTAGKSPFTYQVDVDISPNEHSGSLKDKVKTSLVKNSSVNDPLHDGYPVTKDYIKVSTSEQKRKSTIVPSISKEENKKSTVTGQKISEEKQSHTIKDKSENPSSIKLIDDQTISMSIAQSKTTPVTRSIMRNLSQEHLPDKQFSRTRESVATGTKHNSRASHIGPTDTADIDSKQISTKLGVLNEENSQDLKGKSIKTVGPPQRQSVVRSSRVASSGFAESNAGLETRHESHGSDRKSMKPDIHNEQTADRQSKVHTSPSPVIDHRKSVLHSLGGQDRNSIIAHMSNTPTPSSHSMRASLAQSRRSAVEDRKSKVQTPPSITTSPVSYDRKSVSPSSHNMRASLAQSRKSAVEDRKSKVQTPPLIPTSPVSYDQKSVSPASQNIQGSHAQSRKSEVASRSSAEKLVKEDARKSMKPSNLEQSNKAVPELRKKSLAPSSSHLNNHIISGKTNTLAHSVQKEDDSNEALRQFTKDVFAVDLGSQGKTLSYKSEQKKPSVTKEKTTSEMGPNHEVESKRHSRKSTVGQQPIINALGQSQHEVGNVEPPHELIGDNSAGIGKTPTAQEGNKKPGSLMRTTSKMFTTLTKIGKKKSTEQGTPATETHANKDFVRSIEPTVAQYKKEQDKTHTLTKSKSKSDFKPPKEKRSLTRLFSRSKSKQSNDSGEDKKKTKKSKSRSMLGILKRSKSSEILGAPAEAEEYNTPAVECECIAHYVQNTRACAYFFLGTTLHQQFMNIIKTFLSGN